MVFSKRISIITVMDRGPSNFTNVEDRLIQGERYHISFSNFSYVQNE